MASWGTVACVRSPDWICSIWMRHVSPSKIQHWTKNELYRLTIAALLALGATCCGELCVEARRRIRSRSCPGVSGTAIPCGLSLVVHCESGARCGHCADDVRSFRESWLCCPSSTCGANDALITTDASSLALPDDFVASQFSSARPHQDTACRRRVTSCTMLDPPGTRSRAGHRRRRKAARGKRHVL